ncbi:FecR domain-containing protein [Candidatus Methylacidithermus pantelleriae]|uniref:FecR domain-containing protein n=2 Tax=Candidatus Methylacidithermus pantelleriae TaxID=2744239 RepID=A0A8J2BMX6_9BACT|nr:FecR domain-containing protein [Candidatus Methylacidithermus pantelleriae]
MKMKRRLPIALGLIGLLQSFFVFSVIADPPTRVGRLSQIGGQVSFARAGESQWAPAYRNLPLTTGDRLWSAEQSRCVIHVGSTAIRIGPSTELDFLALEDRFIQLRLPQGLLCVTLHHLREGETIEIDTPSAAIVLLTPGRYRWDVEGNSGSTRLTVWKGQAQVTGSNFNVTVTDGQSLIANQDGYRLDVAGAPDPFDQWVVSEDQREEQARARMARYVSFELTGYEELADEGEWRVVPSYGAVWVPPAPPGWVPYRFGHWIWVDPWGWTWVDDSPWGFATTHYGRWAWIGGVWAWVPGVVVAEPVYAPALVVFAGHPGFWAGIGLGVGVSIGAGWFPLAPGEPYVPCYAVSPVYLRNINVAYVNRTVIQNITQINVTNLTYINRTVPGAFTVASQEAFTRALPVQKALVNVPREALARAPVSPRPPSITPTVSSIQGVMSGRPAPQPPHALLDRPVVALHQPPPAIPPLALRQNALAQHPGLPLAPHELASLAKVHPSAAPTSLKILPSPARSFTPPRQAFQGPHPPAEGGAAKAITPGSFRPWSPTPPSPVPSPGPRERFSGSTGSLHTPANHPFSNARPFRATSPLGAPSPKGSSPGSSRFSPPLPPGSRHMDSRVSGTQHWRFSEPSHPMPPASVLNPGSRAAVRGVSPPTFSSAPPKPHAIQRAQKPSFPTQRVPKNSPSSTYRRVVPSHNLEEKRIAPRAHSLPPPSPQRPVRHSPPPSFRQPPAAHPSGKEKR